MNTLEKWYWKLRDLLLRPLLWLLILLGLSVSVLLTLSENHVFKVMGQIDLGIILSSIVILPVWLVVLTIHARDGKKILKVIMTMMGGVMVISFFLYKNPGVIKKGWTITSGVFSSKHVEAPPPPALTEVIHEYPTSGSGIATKAMPLKAWLDPPKMYVRPTKTVNGITIPRSARYVFASDPSIYFDDVGPGLNNNHTAWANMPAGFYLVYPLKDYAIDFRWWQ